MTTRTDKHEFQIMSFVQRISNKEEWLHLTLPLESAVFQISITAR